MKSILKYFTLIIVSMFVFIGVGNAKELNSEQNTNISEGTKIIYLGRPTCAFCAAYKPGLEYLSEKYSFDYIYVNTDEVSEANQQIWFNKLGIESANFGTPTTVITQNGVVKDTIVGFLTEEELFAKLKSNAVISSDSTFISQYPNLTYIDFSGYKKIVEGNEKALIILAQYTCPSCLNAKAYVDKLASTLNVKINYFNLAFGSEEEYDYFYNSYKYIKEQMDAEKLSTPTFLVVKGDKMYAKLVGFENEQILKEFIDDYYLGEEVQDDLKEPTNYTIFVIILVSLIFVAMLVLTIRNQVAMSKMTKELIIAKESKSKEASKEESKEAPKEELKKEMKSESKSIKGTTKSKKTEDSSVKKEVKKTVKKTSKSVNKNKKPVSKNVKKTK